MAWCFGQKGAHVVIAELNPETGVQAAASLQDDGISAVFKPLDVSQPEQSIALVEQVANT